MLIIILGLLSFLKDNKGVKAVFLQNEIGDELSVLVAYRQQRDLSNQHAPARPAIMPASVSVALVWCRTYHRYPKNHPKLSQPHERITSVTSGRRSLLENMGDAQTVHSDSKPNFLFFLVAAD
jgi:hypothetical protein